jgi:hypothetical protein
MGADFCAIKPLQFRELIRVVQTLVAAYYFPLSTLGGSRLRTPLPNRPALERALRESTRGSNVETELNRLD